ncbi:ABC transporter permease [Paenibacillus tarimensis]|uniref:ABC transporter permease n=1 Tax=Paenibacillus tarimensis TaxID=416012 RepID=UPI001F1DB751|nr:ABC transporter permease [Paenibacillus tarimensis]MCF2945855.1 ABC transporter permease [Paenibacillus tarimensis]
MVRFIATKLMYVLLTLFLLATVTFFMMKAIPGDPFMGEKKLPPAIYNNMIAKYGFDQPVWKQYLTYMNNLLHLDLGESMKSANRTVNNIIQNSFPNSAKLGLVAIIVSVIVGIALGVIAALYHRGLIDALATIVAVLGVSIPSFVLAPLMQYFFAVKLGWFHVAGLKEPLDYVMPVIALSALPIAFIARLTRSNMVEVMNSDYIKTAKSKGLSKAIIINRHALRNAILPVVTYLGPMTANIVTGSVVIEKIFGIAGIGKYFVESVSNRDYTLIMGLTLFYAFILIMARFLTDIAYAAIDPRIKLNSRGGGS